MATKPHRTIKAPQRSTRVRRSEMSAIFRELKRNGSDSTGDVANRNRPQPQSEGERADAARKDSRAPQT